MSRPPHIRAPRTGRCCDIESSLKLCLAELIVSYRPKLSLVRVLLSRRRHTREWKQLSTALASPSSAFSRGSSSIGRLDSHCRRGLRKVTLHALMSLLTM